MMLGIAWAMASEVVLEVETVGIEVTQGTRARLERTLNEVQDFFEHGLGVSYPDTVPVRVRIYGRRDAFKAELKRLGGPSWAGGFFTRIDGAPTALLWKHDSREEMIGVFLHEATHFLFTYAGAKPRWLNEGLAQAFEHSHIAGNVLTVKTPPRYGEYLSYAGAPDAKAVILNRSRWNDLDGVDVIPLYVQGWTVAATLLSTRNGQETLAAMVEGYRAERNRQSGLDAIEATYRGGFAGLQSDLERFSNSPPNALPIPRFREAPAPTVDALWRTCADGRLVAKATPCK